MLVVSMNSKRQRRPNVRLGEIGDAPAAFACGLGFKRWKYDPTNSKKNELSQNNGFSRERSSQIMDSDPGVSPRISADFQQNRENKNPNSSKSAFELVDSCEMYVTKSKLDFTNITRKCRVMKRRGRSTIDGNSFFGGAWGSKHSPEFSCEEGRVCAGKEIVQLASDASNDHSIDCGFNDSSDHETPASSKETCDYDAYEDAWQHGNVQDPLKEDTCDDDNNAFPESGLWDEMGFGGNDVNSVAIWLKELGFGRYAALFEMHEVDEEVLPLLTLEDLKEMGVIAVGPRRKLYTAIKQLRGGSA